MNWFETFTELSNGLNYGKAFAVLVILGALCFSLKVFFDAVDDWLWKRSLRKK